MNSQRLPSVYSPALLLWLVICQMPIAMHAAGRPSPDEALAFLQSLPPLVKKVDGKKTVIHQWKDKTAADIRSMKVLSPGGHIEGGPHLRIKGDDWKYFTAFEQLEKAELWEIEGADDTAFRHLGNLPVTVTWLFVEVAEVTDKGILPLQNLKNLKHLGIGWTKSLGDGAPASIAKISGLEHVILSGCKGITGATLGQLAALKGLKTLAVVDISISDATLPQLATLPIKELNLSQNNITAAGLKKLLSNQASLPNLQTLTLKKVALTDAQLAELKAARPGLTLVR
jgi:hypothetical protein